MEKFNINKIMESIKVNNFSKCAVFAKMYHESLIKDNGAIKMSDINGENCLYIFDKDVKLYKEFDKIRFKKYFLNFIIDSFNDKEKIKMFSNSELEDIYELCIVYSDYIEFDITNHNQNGELIININGKLFNINKKTIVSWFDEYIDDFPFLVYFKTHMSDDDILKNISMLDVSTIEENIEDLEDDILDGYQIFDLDSILLDDDYDDYE